MKIFPIKPLSNMDSVRNLYKIITGQTPKKVDTLNADIAIFGENKSLKKGRCICDMLSE